MNDKKPRKGNLGDHSPFDEDGVTFDEPWMWEDEADEDEIKGQWQQGTGTDLTPRKD